MCITDNIEYRHSEPGQQLSDCVKCFWYLRNNTAQERVVTILPDGYFDILFFSVNNGPFLITLVGLATKPGEYIVPKNAVTFAISFKLLAAEYLLNISVSQFIDKAKHLPAQFWDINLTSIAEFEDFVASCSKKMMAILKKDTDERKKQLFSILYADNGSAAVEEIAQSVHWTSRQMNRYFKCWFGLSLKAYCNILRYRASFAHIKDGELHPKENYSDQAHFIKEVKKFSGVTPKKLAENKNDRFIQFSTLPRE